MFRWLPYATKRQPVLMQPGMPGWAHPVHSGSYRLPAGYTVPSSGDSDIRTAVTPDIVAVPASSWVTDNRMKLSAPEIMSRGAQAHDIGLQRAAGNISHKEAEDEYKRLGVRDLPLFSELSYFKYGPIHPRTPLLLPYVP